MSLELAIAENTRTLQQLISILRDQASNPVPRAPEPETPADPPKSKRVRKAEPAPEETAPSPEPTAPDAPATEAAATAIEPATYDQAAAAVTALIKANGRDAAVSLLKRFGAANLKGVDPSQYGELIAAARDEAVPF